MVELRATTSFPSVTEEAILNCEIILGVASLGLLIGAKYRTDTCQTTMAASITINVNMSTESIQVAAEDAGEFQITFMDPKLYVAAADGDIHVLEQYDDIHFQLTPKNNTVLHVAAQFGRADCVKWILQLPSPPSLLQLPNEKGDTPLHLAAREGHLTVVKNLIDAAKQLEEGDAEGGAAAVCKEMLRKTNKVKDAAMHEAVRNHHPKVVKLLIQEDPDFTYAANTEGNTPLYIAAEWGFGDLVQMILDNCNSPDYSGMKGRTALHAAVILNDKAMTKKILEWKPALTKELDENGWSPLHCAACVGCHPTIVTQLLEKSETYVVYLGVKDNEIGNRTALHIAANRGHVNIVKLLVSHFPDCCEKVDKEGNNVLHLIMPKRIKFLSSGICNVRWLAVRGLMIEKNVERKTPLHLWHSSPASILTTILMRIFEIFTGLGRWSRSFRVSSRPLGSLEVGGDSDSSDSSESIEREELSEINKTIKSQGTSEGKESEEISEIKKTMKNHMIVAALIATVTFAAGFTLPGGYIQDEGNYQGMAVLSLPTNGTSGKDRDMAIAVRKSFRAFVVADSIAMITSVCAIGIYFIASFAIKSKKTVEAFLFYGYLLTFVAMAEMVAAFGMGLQAVLYHSSLLEHTTDLIIPLFFLLFFVPCIFILSTNHPNFGRKQFVSLSH